VLVYGLPGLGKSHWCTLMVEKLRSLSIKVEVVSNNALRIWTSWWSNTRPFGSDGTCYLGACSADEIFLEEYTQTDVNLIAVLDRVSHIQFLVADAPPSCGSCFKLKSLTGKPGNSRGQIR